MRIYPLVIAVSLLCGGLTGCSDSPAENLEEYPQRLARALDVEAPVLAVSALPPRLSASAWLQALPQPSIGLLDFLSLGGCRLGSVVAEGNSTLGKVAAGSQQMHQQRDFILTAPACEAQLRQQNKSELADELAAARQQKLRHRMAIWWNGWLSGTEWQAFTARSAELQSWQDVDDGYQSAALEALDYAIGQGRQWQQSALDYDATAMERQLQQLALSEGLGRWLRTQAYLTAVMEQAETLVQQRLQDRPLCPTGSKTPAAEIVRNVVFKFYIGGLQLYMSRNDRFGEQLLQRLQQIYELATSGQAGESDPAALRQYQSRLEYWQQARTGFQQRSQAHVAAVSELFRQCGIQPASD